MALVVTRTALHDPDADREFWRSQSVEARLAAVEVLRQRVFGLHDAAGPRLQRVCRVVHRA
jgi:hypothetical protein